MECHPYTEIQAEPIMSGQPLGAGGLISRETPGSTPRFDAQVRRNAGHRRDGSYRAGRGKPAATKSDHLLGSRYHDLDETGADEVGAPAGAAGLNATKIAAIAWHTVPSLIPEEARQCAAIISCSALDIPCSGPPTSLFPARETGLTARQSLVPIA